MIYCFDIDGTLCDTPNNEFGKPDYVNAKPVPFMVEQVNRLYDEGNHIIMQTARGKGSGIDHTELTKKQLNEWGYKYHELFPMFCKPTADIFIDDKGINVEDWKNTQPLKCGIIASAFDVIHPGYIRMFKDAKLYCNHLTVALHEDPSVERSIKLKPVQTVEERKEILQSIRYVDNVVTYKVEEEYLNYLKSGEYNVRFLGTDYKTRPYTGPEIPIDIVWLDRESHEYSSTRLKTQIYESVKAKKEQIENYD
jgi:glycerol-3-phosphate cytidylyltransferase